MTDQAWPEPGQAEVEAWLGEAVRLAREAGNMIAAAMAGQQNTEIQTKEERGGEGNGSAVLTETDGRVEQLLISGLRAAFPDHKFIGEESVSEAGQIREFTNAPTWIIDPIDGTMNFIHSNPLVCTSIGLTVNRRLVAGLVHCPLIDKLYTAVRGGGAFCNGLKISTSRVTNPAKAMMIMELPVGANKEKQRVALANLSQMLERAHAVRAPGPAAMDIAWVGAGSADCYFHFGIHCWDMAAGALIVSEAGGAVRDPAGGEFDLMSRDILVCSSEQLADQIVSWIQIYKTDREIENVYTYL